MTMTMTKSQSKYADKLAKELDKMCIAQFDSPEFRLMFETPLTLARAQFYAVQLVLYGMNRRDCWAYVSARAPYDVKQAIWHHEQDELIHDPRGGTDHVALMSKESRAIGVTEDDLENATPTPLTKAAFMAFCHLNSTVDWLAALTASHFLERRNNSAIIKAGGSSKRWRDRLVDELGIDPEKLYSLNVHIEADVDHSDMIWDTIAAYVKDEDDYKNAIHGAREVSMIDRAYRGAIAHGMEAIED